MALTRGQPFCRSLGLEAKRYGSGGPYEEIIGYSRVVVMNGMAWTAGTTAMVDVAELVAAKASGGGA